jgi:hypothetical protein
MPPSHPCRARRYAHMHNMEQFEYNARLAQLASVSEAGGLTDPEGQAAGGFPGGGYAGAAPPGARVPPPPLWRQAMYVASGAMKRSLPAAYRDAPWGDEQRGAGGAERGGSGHSERAVSGGGASPNANANATANADSGGGEPGPGPGHGHAADGLSLAQALREMSADLGAQLALVRSHGGVTAAVAASVSDIDIAGADGLTCRDRAG